LHTFHVAYFRGVNCANASTLVLTEFVHPWRAFRTSRKFSLLVPARRTTGTGAAASRGARPCRQARNLGGTQACKKPRYPQNPPQSMPWHQVP